ncbi:3'-5' ssDNA/RNA exonuclease TatD [Teleopsis dalmanni]|uniref:3'-5' ssDNA/RNA exonuclease TatD-like n=1 Tax=Teleopsis dalmanni TaxID=139649 RepID=UPI0018CCCBA9|nr:3'-5' ssDNA/RNA exonuclease TatD-like [Teleopsis dalmanni]XP_037946205.1 3'-5' ssDNA/RNA exonuclease TatD [Teleopsis dalmanni]
MASQSNNNILSSEVEESSLPLPLELKHCFDNLIVIDAGANLTNKKYSRDLESVIQRAKDAGVQKIMVPGTSVKSSKEALRLSRLYPDIIYSTAGIHPHDSKSIIEEPTSWFEFTHIAESQECVAIGPCGLDYQRDFSEPEVQKEIFEKQINLACSLGKALLIHERSAQKDVLDILDKFEHLPPAIIIRGFMGTCDEAIQYLNRRFYISLTGYLCKDKSDTGVRKLLEDGTIPLDRLLVETDSPFMYPNTRASKLPQNVKTAITERSLLYLHRYCTFQRNEPCSLPAIVEMIAAFMNKTPDEVALATAFNALKLFGLS